QLGERVAQRLGLSLRFVETPNRRIDGFMASGHIHVICNSNPGWDSKPERYHWSPALFEEQDVLLFEEGRRPMVAFGFAIPSGVGVADHVNMSAGHEAVDPSVRRFHETQRQSQPLRDPLPQL
ncbi:ABC transporter substrate-binding protein, partial [Pseudomonas aeruginosa]